MVAWVVAVERLALVEQISLGDEAAVNIAVLEVDGCLAVMLNMGDFFATAFANGTMVD